MTSVCVAYSGRADQSPLRPVMEELRNAGCELSICNLDSGGGPEERILGAWKTTTLGFSLNKPDWLLVLGDRYETISACLMAVINGIRIAHIHGGEISEGSFDDSLRNAISMMADLHFASAREHKERLVKMGIKRDRIIVSGAPGLDNMIDLPERNPSRTFVVTYLPATRANEDVRELLKALDAFPKYRVVFTGYNADPGSGEIALWIKNWKQGELIQDMSSRGYFRLLRNSACVIGNSSSGLIEAPSLLIPTVNVGDRQKGRLRGPSVFDCPCKSGEIIDAINKAIKHEGPWTNPYGGPGASKIIAETLSDRYRLAA